MQLCSAVDHVGNQCYKFNRRFVLFVAIHCRYIRSVILVNTLVVMLHVKTWGKFFLIEGRVKPLLVPASFGRDSISRWSLLSGVYARGSKRSHTGGKCVNCHGLHYSSRLV